MLEEAQVACPYCWQPLTLLLDLSEPAQEYIEDCQVCCQPMSVRYTSCDGELLSVEADRTDT
ncbi:MAG: CPXCG motif-containing cysteine-rich protein [Gammaproteobacteria bacterium]|nr:CPXCG motif-containing cysteine-rich protein [Gammaproteobacteria bacterium]